MNYTSLYRKFRPLNFDEMVGQEHITKTLKNQIISNRIGHAYLFNGGRGTGKTSAAKILARAVNCLDLKDGNPCNECEICKAILDGSLTDVVEMDAASNNSVEDIRGIREEVNFLPTLAKYRVYIIDEVHMLSTGAFNALLKTLEEPPAHVKFILATTEPQKLPATILSRCQRFDFKKISVENIAKRLRLICDEINVKISDNALNLIGVISEGAMRDSLSILERCIQDGDNDITEDKIRDMIGIPKLEYISKTVESIINFDVDSAILVTEEILNEGKDINYLLWEIIKYLNNMLIYKSCGKINIYNENDANNLKNIADKTNKQRILNLIYEFSNLENDIKWTSQKNIMFQSGIIKMCIKIDVNDFETRIKKLEELESLNAEIEPLDPVKDKDKLDEIQEKITKAVEKKNLNLDMFMNHCSKNNINVSKDFLEKLVEENSFAHDKEGNIKLDKTLNNIAKGYNKRIKTYQKANEKIPGAQLTVENGQALGIDPDPQGTQKTTVLQKLTSDPMSHVTQQTNSAQPPAKKFKWWQFKKRFDDWRQRRQANKQTTIDPATTTQTSTTGEVSTKKFRDAYKYDIVKDYVDSQEEQLFRQTARDVRRGDKTQDQDQDGQR